MQISKDDKLTVKWLDGSSYIGTVIRTGEAVAKVQPEGYPREYTLWITSNEFVGTDVDKDSGKKIISLLYQVSQIQYKDLGGPSDENLALINGYLI